MAKIAKRVIWWASVSDAVKYHIRIIPDTNGFDYNFAPNLTIAHDGSLGEHEADLAGLALAEGVYDIFITAEDAGENESDPLELADAVLDFTPPSAPSDGGFR